MIHLNVQLSLHNQNVRKAVSSMERWNQKEKTQEANLKEEKEELQFNLNIFLEIWWNWRRR